MSSVTETDPKSLLKPSIVTGSVALESSFSSANHPSALAQKLEGLRTIARELCESLSRYPECEDKNTAEIPSSPYRPPSGHALPITPSRRRASVERGSLSPRPTPDRDRDASFDEILTLGKASSIHSICASPASSFKGQSFITPSTVPPSQMLSSEKLIGEGAPLNAVNTAAAVDDLLGLVELLQKSLAQCGDPGVVAASDASFSSSAIQDVDEEASARAIRLASLLKSQSAMLQATRLELDVERGTSKVLRQENEELRRSAVQMHAQTEAEDEQTTNRLLNIVRKLHKEKAQLLIDVEREEEYLTNTLQRKLRRLQEEKIEMENQLEMEQEFMVNRLQKQLHAAMRANQKDDDGATEDGETDSDAERFKKEQKAELHRRQFDVLRAEIRGLHSQVTELERENHQKLELLKLWRQELLILRQKEGRAIEDLFTEEQLRSVAGRRFPASVSPSLRSSRVQASPQDIPVRRSSNSASLTRSVSWTPQRSAITLSRLEGNTVQPAAAASHQHTHSTSHTHAHGDIHGRHSSTSDN